MKIFLVLLLSSLPAFAGTITGTVGGQTNGTTTAIRLTFSPTSTPFVGTNGTLYFTTPISIMPTIGTSFSINLVPGLYNVLASTGDRFTILVPEDMTATNTIASITTNLTSFAITNYLFPVPYWIIEAGLTNALSSSFFKSTPGAVQLADSVPADVNTTNVTTTNLTVYTTFTISGNIYASGSNYLGQIVGLGSGGLNGNTYAATNLGTMAATNVASFIVTATNGYFIPSNNLASWPAAPRTVGEVYVGNSNGWIYMLNGGLSGAWSKTNLIAEP